MFDLLLIYFHSFIHIVILIDIGRCGVSANKTTLHPNNNLRKVNHYRSMYGLQHGTLAQTEQQAIKGPKITSVKPFKRENQRSNLYKMKNEKRETRINCIKNDN